MNRAFAFSFCSYNTIYYEVPHHTGEHLGNSTFSSPQIPRTAHPCVNKVLPAAHFVCQTTRYQNTEHLAFQCNMRLDEIRVHLIFHHYISSGLSRGRFVMFNPVQPSGIRPFPRTKKARFRSLHCTEQEYDSFRSCNPPQISFFLSTK